MVTWKGKSKQDVIQHYDKLVTGVENELNSVNCRSNYWVAFIKKDSGLK